MNISENPSQILSKLVTLYNTLNEFLVKFSQSTTAYYSTTPVQWQDDEGLSQTINIPSLGYINSEVTQLKQQIESLISVNGDKISLSFTDGTVRTFDMRKVSQLVESIESIKDSSFAVPAEFRVKNNWFFESYLNPLIYVSIDVKSQLTDNSIRRFSVRRVMLNTISTVEQKYFDDNFKGRGDIDYDTFINSLKNNGIDYFEDDNTVDMPVSINRYRGSFSVVNYAEETVTVNGGTVKRMRYTLDKMFYSDIINLSNGTKHLAVNDVLLTANDTEYRVLSLDIDTNSVVLEKQYGNEPINIGANVLKIKPFPYRIPELQINVGYNERETIFVKPIVDGIDLTTDMWSKGFAIYTNELKITMSDTSVIGLEDYYKNFVTDFGMILLNFAKEKQVPSAMGIVPSAPVVNVENFKVVLVNSHLKEDKSVIDLKNKIATKEKLENEMDELAKTINTLKAKLNDSTSTNDQERLKIKKQIDDAVIKRTSSLNQLSTTIKEITLSLKTNATFKTSSKYRVRGFCEIPPAISTAYGTQEIIQFLVNYRYISKKGNASNVEQINYTDQNGIQQIGFFSNWQEILGKLRKKTYDETTGLYVWAQEDIKSPDVVNINQFDIPITTGEAVEIRIKAISEAGYPINPAESDWSASVIVSFPDDIEAQDEDSSLAESLQTEDILVKFQEELNARGLDSHLLNVVTTGDRYYGHRAEDIISGYYTPEGKIINVFEKIKDLENRILAIENAMNVSRGILKVQVRDEDGNVVDVQNGNTVSMFAGYYKELIQDQNAYDHGKVISKAYTIVVSNTSQTALELASRLAGGIGERVTTSISTGTEDYDVNRKYDIVPLVATSMSDADGYGQIKQPAPFQSSQVKSQFIYGRYKDYDLANELYPNVDLYDTANGFYFASYDYKGNANDDSMPYNGGVYLPYAPNINIKSGLAKDANVWSGKILSGTPVVPDGGGYLSEFCIHKDHPYLQGLAADDYTTSLSKLNDVFMPDGGGKQGYYQFAHGLFFDIPVSEKTRTYQSVILINNNEQSPYHVPVAGSPVDHDGYPVKLGFNSYDEYLIGRYTCGAYLYLAPNNYNDISIIGNHPLLAKRVIQLGAENAVNIPVIFQFRCSDKIAKVGGFSSTGSDLTNIAYTKKIGVDIYEKDSTKSVGAQYGDVFSFDIEIRCKYMNETPIVTPISMSSSQYSNTTFGTGVNTDI